MKAHAARFRHRVTVQTKTVTETAMGGTQSWADVETRWAIVVPATPTTRMQYQARDSQADFFIVLRGEFAYDLGNHRFKWDGRTFVPSDPEYHPGDRQEFTVVPVLEKPEEGQAPNP